MLPGKQPIVRTKVLKFCQNDEFVPGGIENMP